MSNDTRVTLIGAGKMGLPIACSFANRGAHVIACDKNEDVVRTINSGSVPFDEPGLAEMLSEVVAAGRLTASTNTVEAVRKSNVVVVLVPVLLTPENEADISIISSVTKQIAEGMQPGTMVVYETTLPVGTTRSLLPILETSGLKAGRDFDLVFSPERVKSQLVLQRLTENAKIVGGITDSAAERGAEFYGKYLGAPVINVKTLEAAELVKLAGMVYRDVNIALANELAAYADRIGVDIMPVIQAANTDGEAQILMPGIGVGGHCTPVYPHFLVNDATRKNVAVNIIQHSRLRNDDQPAYMIDLLEEQYGSVRGKRIGILGLGFRPQVKESLYSPAFVLRDELKSRNADVVLHDPLYDAGEISAEGFEGFSLDERNLPEVLVLNTAHAQYKKIDLRKLSTNGVKAIVDGRNLFNPADVQTAGIKYIGVGRGNLVAAAEQSNNIPISKPDLDHRESRAVDRIIRSGWIMQGPEVARLERDFAAYLGVADAVAVSSGTTALHLALMAVGVEPGDEVITVSHSFIATANSIGYCGAIPVFVDIQPDTYNIDPSLVEAAISPKTRAILCVHQMGMPCDLKAIGDIARKHNLALVEDAACALGSEVSWNKSWEMIGKPHSDVACFSFHPRKLLTTGDGGMLTVKNQEQIEKLKLWRNHGIDPKTGNHVEFGFNYRMTDMQAAVGREQLRKLPSIIAERKALAQRYFELLSAVNGLRLPSQPNWARTNWQSVCIGLPDAVDQSKIIQTLSNAGIASRKGITCTHRQAAYKHRQWRAAGTLAASERAEDHSIILPLFSGMTEREQDRVITELQNALSESKAQHAVAKERQPN